MTRIDKAKTKPARVPRLEYRLYWWLCLPVILLSALITGFLIYGGTGTFTGDARSDGSLLPGLIMACALIGLLYAIIRRVTRLLSRSVNDYVTELQQETRVSALSASEIAIAGIIRQDLLVHDVQKAASRYGIDIGVSLAPAERKTGDFYGAVARPDGRFLCAVGNVSGKGVAAALIARDCVSQINTCGQDLDPAQLLQQMNANLFDRLSRQSMFVTLVCCLLDVEKGILTHCNAGHEMPFLYHAGNGQISRLDMARNNALGFLPDEAYQASDSKLEKEHTLLLYGEGKSDSPNQQGSSSGLPPVLTVLCNKTLSNVDLQTRSRCINMQKQEGEPYDDVTLLGVSLETSEYRSFHIPPQLDEVGGAISRLQAQLEEGRVAREYGNRLKKVLEEWVGNLIRFSGAESDIIICSRYEPDGVDLEIIASCNSSASPPQKPELEAFRHLQSHAAGGYGIHVISELVDDVTCETDASWVRLKVRIDTQEPDLLSIPPLYG